MARKTEWNRARGIPLPLTKEERGRLAWNKAYILEQQRRALNKEVARQKALAETKLQLLKKAGYG